MQVSCLDVFNASNLVPMNQDTILAADIPFFFDRTSYIGDSTLAGKQARPQQPPAQVSASARNLPRTQPAGRAVTGCPGGR